MGATMELEEHYSQLLGINSPWEIYDVELKVDESRLDIWIEWMTKGPALNAVRPAPGTTRARNALGVISIPCSLLPIVPRVRCERCQPWRAKRRLVDPSSREAALFSRRALRQRENKVGLRTWRPVIGSQVRSSNELAKLLRSAW